MAYHYENLKLEKGMYSQSGRSFAQTLEALDPSENYKGTSLEGLDAFQRQLKRFDIKVKGAGSDRVEKFFWSTESAVLFPEFVSRVVRQGMEEESILPDITATVTTILTGWITALSRPLLRRRKRSSNVWRRGRRSPRPPFIPRRIWCGFISGAVCWWLPMRPSAFRDWTCLP